MKGEINEWNVRLGKKEKLKLHVKKKEETQKKTNLIMDVLVMKVR